MPDQDAGPRVLMHSRAPPLPEVLLAPMRPKELTLRGLILGVLLTTVFTAANVYLGLKVGLTFASSIPAAVISMAILSARPCALASCGEPGLRQNPGTSRRRG